MRGAISADCKHKKAGEELIGHATISSGGGVDC
jgi:hypothetical protein